MKIINYKKYFKNNYFFVTIISFLLVNVIYFFNYTSYVLDIKNFAFEKEKLKAEIKKKLKC